MTFFIESTSYYGVRLIGFFLRLLPVHAALWFGRMAGLIACYVDLKHRSQVYANLKIAFSNDKTPRELRRLTKKVFQNYGQILVELLRFPLMTKERIQQYVEVEGREHVDDALKLGRGVILLAMHNGSWELANAATAMMGRPYKVIVKPQTRFTKLDQLLNSYRACGGSVVLEKGMGTREFVKSLRNNETVGLVVDQGGKDGMLVPFFNRHASMSVGAIRMGLKLGVPICFAIIRRVSGPYHRLTIHPPMELTRTGDVEGDITVNLRKIVTLMENYLRDNPTEYTWFYKIWKYSKEFVAVILNDGKTGHLRQSQSVARSLERALAERQITVIVKTVEAAYRNVWAARMVSVLAIFATRQTAQGRIGLLKWFLTEKAYRQIISIRADFVISCGSSTAALNYLVSHDQQAKSIAILTPGILGFSKFDLVFLPRHDRKSSRTMPGHVIFTYGAPNLIDDAYLEEQKNALLKRFSHLKTGDKFRIGLLIGGDTKQFYIDEPYLRLVINQLKEVAYEIRAEILVSTSRRTSQKIESLVQYEFRRHEDCRLLVIVNRQNYPETVGGIIQLSDMLIVSGDSISMISEAASSGKKTIVFPVQRRSDGGPDDLKHERFIQMLNDENFILSTDGKDLKRAVYTLVKDKVHLKTLDDNAIVLEAVRRII